MYTISLRVDDELKEEMAEYAVNQNINQSEIIRRALNIYLKENSKRGSFYELTKDIVGSYSGPSDLSTNPKYMEGFGE